MQLGFWDIMVLFLRGLDPRLLDRLDEAVTMVNGSSYLGIHIQVARDTPFCQVPTDPTEFGAMLPQKRHRFKSLHDSQSPSCIDVEHTTVVS